MRRCPFSRALRCGAAALSWEGADRKGDVDGVWKVIRFWKVFGRSLEGFRMVFGRS